jgi:hypothetical protein
MPIHERLRIESEEESNPRSYWADRENHDNTHLEEVQFANGNDV